MRYEMPTRGNRNNSAAFKNVKSIHRCRFLGLLAGTGSGVLLANRGDILEHMSKLAWFVI
jgi:hypothetical protein